MRITTNYMLLASVLTACALATACSEEKFQETPDRDEIYAREFIKEFGTPDPDHDWTMATTAGLRVNAPDPVSLQVYAEIDGQLYIFADIPGYKGENAVPVTIPKGTEELIVVADGKEYRCSPSATLDLTTAQPARGSRATHITVRDPNKKGGDFIITVDNSETGYVTFNLDENPALKKILDDPYNSEYLRQGSDNGYWLGGPLMPNASNHYASHYSEAQSFDIYPLYINDGLGNTKMPRLSLGMCMTENKLEKNYTGTVYTLIPQITSLYTSSNGSDWEANCVPTSENGPYVKSSRVSVDIDIDGGRDLYISYAIASQYSGKPSHSYSWFNYTPWGTDFYDAPIKDMNTCYCSTLFYKEVPVKWSVNGGNTVETEVAMYAMYHAPKSPADKRPEKPDVFFMEHHGYGFVEWDQEFGKRKTAATYRWRIFAEDLGGSHDWDFNDLVVEYTDVLTRYVPNPIPENFKLNENGEYEDENGWEWDIPPYSNLYPKFENEKTDEKLMVREISVTPLAAGGTMPIYLGWKGELAVNHPINPDMLLSEVMSDKQYMDFKKGDFIIGTELHKWLGGSSYHQPINVGDKVTNTGKPIKFYIPANIETYGYNTEGTFSAVQPILCQLYVIVDPDNSLTVDTSENFNPSSTTDNGKSGITQFSLNDWNNGYTVHHPLVDPSSKTPQMFVTYQYMKWAKEGVGFHNAYPRFYEFVADKYCVQSWTMLWVEEFRVQP